MAEKVRPRRHLGVLAILVMAVGGGCAVTGTSSAGDTVVDQATVTGPEKIGGCVLTMSADAPSYMGGDYDPPYSPIERRWHDARARIAKVIEPRFGANTMGNPNPPLSRGLIGEVPDYPRALAVVVDPALLDRAILEPRLRAAGAPGIEVRVHDGCHTTAALREAQNVLEKADWHPAAPDAAWGYSLDPHSATWIVSIDDKRPDVADALRERLGHRVTIMFGPGPVPAKCHAAAAPSSSC